MSHIFSDRLEPFAMPCMRVHVSDVSIWLSSLPGLPTHGSVPLAGTFGVTGVFSDAFELLATLSSMLACVCDASIWSLGLSASSMHDTAHLALLSPFQVLLSWSHRLEHLCGYSACLGSFRPLCFFWARPFSPGR